MITLSQIDDPMNQAISFTVLAAQDFNQAFPSQPRHGSPSFVSICSILTQPHRLNLPYVAVWEHKVMQLVWQNKSRHIGLCSSQSMANVREKKKKKRREKSGAHGAQKQSRWDQRALGLQDLLEATSCLPGRNNNSELVVVRGIFLNNWPNPVHTSLDWKFNAQARSVCGRKDWVVLNPYDWHQELVPPMRIWRKHSDRASFCRIHDESMQL